jgi:hypothetical protein
MIRFFLAGAAIAVGATVPLAALPGVLILSILDWLIGPW